MKRLERLEASASDTALKVIIVEDGETQAQALKRVGLSPDARGVLYLTPLDALL